MSHAKLNERESTNIYDFVDSSVYRKSQPIAELNFIQEVDTCGYPAIYDEPQKALDILVLHGYQPKVFCFAEMEDHTSGFKVFSDRCNWVVSSGNIDNIKQTPSDILKSIPILLKNDVKIDDIAIAKPELQESVPDVINQEKQLLLNTLSNIVGSFFRLIGVCMKTAVNCINIVSNNVSPARLIQHSDPILLIRIQDVWIEIGRWE